MKKGALFISAGGYHHHLGLNLWAGIGAPPPSPSATGLAYHTIVFPDAQALEAVLERLRSAGIALHNKQTQGLGQPGQLIDQDQNQPQSAAEQTWFVHDPSGITVKLCIA